MNNEKQNQLDKTLVFRSPADPNSRNPGKIEPLAYHPIAIQFPFFACSMYFPPSPSRLSQYLVVIRVLLL